jgi:hypothetical protein
MDDPRARLAGLLDEVRAAHDAFGVAIGRVDPGLVEAPGLVGSWSAAQLLAHLAFWAEHAVDALRAAADGRADSFGDEDIDVDGLNAEVAAGAAGAAYPALQQREAAAFAGVLAALEHLPSAALDDQVRYGDSIETVVRDDTIDHYLEHAADVDAWFSAGPDGEESDEEG